MDRPYPRVRPKFLADHGQLRFRHPVPDGNRFNRAVAGLDALMPSL